jgi:hypothetical protein
MQLDIYHPYLLYSQVEIDQRRGEGTAFAVKCIKNEYDQWDMAFKSTCDEKQYSISYACIAYSASSGNAKKETDMYIEMRNTTPAKELRSHLNCRCDEVHSIEIIESLAVQGNECNRILQLGRSPGCTLQEFGKRNRDLNRFITPVVSDILAGSGVSFHRNKFVASIDNLPGDWKFDCLSLGGIILYAYAVKREGGQHASIYVETVSGPRQRRDQVEEMFKEMVQDITGVVVQIEDLTNIDDEKVVMRYEELRKYGQCVNAIVNEQGITERGQGIAADLAKIEIPPMDYETDLSESNPSKDTRHLWVLTHNSDWDGKISEDMLTNAIEKVSREMLAEPMWAFLDLEVRRLYIGKDSYWGYVLVCFSDAVKQCNVEKIMEYMDEVPWCDLDMDEYQSVGYNLPRKRPASFSKLETFERCRDRKHPVWELYRYSQMTLVFCSDGREVSSVARFCRDDPINPSKYWILTYAGETLTSHMIKSCSVVTVGARILELHTLAFDAYKYSLLHFEAKVPIGIIRSLMCWMESYGIKWQNLTGYESAECLNLENNVAFQFMQRACCRMSERLSTWSCEDFVRPTFESEPYPVKEPVYPDDTDDVLKKEHAINGMCLAVGTDVSQIVLGDQASYFHWFRQEVEHALVPLPEELWMLSDLVKWCATDVLVEDVSVPWWKRADTFGSVYLIQNKSDELKLFGKIGYTSYGTPFERVFRLSRCMPERSEVVVYIKTLLPYELERAIHKHFDSARCVRGQRASEFFNLNVGMAKRYFEDLANGKQSGEFSYEDMCIMDKTELSLKSDIWDENDATHNTILACEINWMLVYKTVDLALSKKVGWVYVCINPCFQYLVKIGCSRDLRRRMDDLKWNTPKRFRLISCIRSLDPHQLETSMHKHFARFRHQTAEGVPTEYFKLEAAEVKAYFKTFHYGELYD